MLVDIKDIRARLITEFPETRLVRIKYTPHYKLLCGNVDVYKDYLKIANQPDHSFKKYLSLINKFETIKAIPIQCYRYEGEIVIRNGLHRACILLKMGYKQIEIEL